MSNEVEIKIGQRWKSNLNSAAVHTVIFVGQNAAFMKNKEGNEFAVDFKQLRKFYDLVPETMRDEQWYVVVNDGFKTYRMGFKTQARALEYIQEVKGRGPLWSVTAPIHSVLEGEIV